MPARTNWTQRLNPDTGVATEAVGILQFNELLVNTSSQPTNGVRFNQYAQYGAPIKLGRIASNTNTVRAYPYDGTGTVAGAASGSVTLASDVGETNIDIVGLLVLCYGGSMSTPEVRRITAYDTGTNVATVEYNWNTNPNTSSTYRLLVDVWRMSALNIKTEFTSSSASTTCQLQVFWYDCGLWTESGIPGLRATLDGPYTVSASGISYDSSVTGALGGPYYHGTPVSIGNRGYCGVKVYITSISTGNISIWAGGS